MSREALKESVEDKFVSLIRDKLHTFPDSFEFPPAVYKMMQGEILNFDADKGIFANRFPVLREQLNPFGNMQGGMIAAVIDNTVGPLSILVAPASFTRYMDLKYRKAIPLDVDFIYVTARFVEQKKRQIFFTTTVCSEEGEEFASAKSTHWMI